MHLITRLIAKAGKAFFLVLLVYKLFVELVHGLIPVEIIKDPYVLIDLIFFIFKLFNFYRGEFLKILQLAVLTCISFEVRVTYVVKSIDELLIELLSGNVPNEHEPD